MNTCRCGKPRDYGDLCRDCYEDKLRREARDALDKEWVSSEEYAKQKTRCRGRRLKAHANAIDPKKVCSCTRHF